MEKINPCPCEDESTSHRWPSSASSRRRDGEGAGVGSLAPNLAGAICKVAPCAISTRITKSVMPARPVPDSRAWKGARVGCRQSRRGVDVMMERGCGVSDCGLYSCATNNLPSNLGGGLLVDAEPFSLMENAKAWLELSILSFLMTFFS
jgi:hypothetical protein